MLRRIFLSFTFSLVSDVLFAQTGSIKGSIKDVITGEGVIGASVYIVENSLGAAADVNGDFEIPKLKAGSYTLLISFISYKTDTLKNIVVYPDQTTVVNTTLAEESQQLTEVVVKGAKVTNTDVSIITEIKKNDLVAVGISAQQISMSQDRDAAQIMKRIPGVTIIGNRFVNVRGLSERYSTVLLNGVIAPSSEVDSKAFSFDLIPSGMIDRMMVYKSGSAELPGEFAGAVIAIQTKNVIDDNSLSVNFTTSFRPGTTFNNFATYKGSNTDRIGFDNGNRQLPSSFPQQNLGLLKNANELTNASKSLPNNWNTSSKTAIPDYRVSINFTKAAYFGNKKLSNISSISYASLRQHIYQETDNYDINKENITLRRHYNDNRYAESFRVGLISNFILELNPTNKIEFRNLLNQQGLSQVTHRTGVEVNEGQEVRNLGLNYVQKRIYAGQLQGKHSLNEKINLSWILATSQINADQPDYRRIRSQRASGTDNPYTIVLPSSSSTLDAGRFYSELNEKVYTHTLGLDYKLNPSVDEDKQSKISVGYYLAQTQRDFSARWFAYKQAKLGNPAPDALKQGGFNEIFIPENIGLASDEGAPYFMLDEGTNASDKYDAQNLLAAGYVNLTIPFSAKFRFSSGLRTEYNKQVLNSFNDQSKPVKVNKPVTSVLPFFNLSFNYTEKSLIRLAYSKTVNRAVFRELAPFNFYDFDRNANFYGNPNLVTCDIQNVDLRWENYPSKNENISIGVFYKHFKNPIEIVLVGGSNAVYTWENAASAQTFGAEIEARKSLSGITSSTFIDKFSVLFNASIIKSQVNTSNLTNQDGDRAMQGQSPYVINAGLYYNNYETGLQANVSYNVFGSRIFAVGDKVGNRNLYDMPRNQIDITVSKDISTHWEIKFGVQDILNQSNRVIVDLNNDKNITGNDDPFQGYRPGQYISLGLNYKL